MEEPQSLLACPFCGSENTPVELGNQYEENFKLQCVDCKATTGRYRTRPEAMEAWNVRAGAMARGATDGSRFAACGGSVPEGWRHYLVEYEYDGSRWNLDILATDDADASARVDALMNARLLGDCKMRIPAFAGAGILTRGLCALRNFLWK